MTKPMDLPEAAEEEPRILSPEELAEHAWHAHEESVAAELRGERLDTAGASNPLRMPGELASPVSAGSNVRDDGVWPHFSGRT